MYFKTSDGTNTGMCVNHLRRWTCCSIENESLFHYSKQRLIFTQRGKIWIMIPNSHPEQTETLNKAKNLLVRTVTF